MEISCIYTYIRIVWRGSPFLSGIIFFGQLSRKRFIGNDVVVVVFYEGNTPLQLDFGGFIRMRPPSPLFSIKWSSSDSDLSLNQPAHIFCM